MNATPSSPSTGVLWTGRILSALVLLFLILDGAMKLMQPAQVVAASRQLGFSSETTTLLGVLVLACAVLYLFPRTAAFGALILTGYLGGAVACQIKIGAPVVACFFPVIFCALAWAGVILRRPGYRVMLPWE